MSDLGQFFMAVNIAAFDDPLAYKRRMADFLQHVKASPRADPDTEILVAGEKEHRASERSKVHGVSLDREVAQALAGHAERYRVDLPYADPR